MTKPDDEKPSPKQVLSANLRALLASDVFKVNTIKQVAEASKGLRRGSEDVHLSNGKVGRIYKGEQPTDVDSLYGLAAVFHLEPWQLLVPGLNPKALPKLASPQLLDEIRDLVSGSAATVTQTEVATDHSEPVKQVRAREMSPALKRSLVVKGTQRNEPDKAVGVSKQRTRGGNKGPSGAGRRRRGSGA